MTDNANIAKALRLIGEGVYELADALMIQPGPSAESPPKASSPLAATPAGSPVPADTPERSPFEDEAVTWQPPDSLEPILAATGGVEVGTQSERDRVLAECPIHFRAWTIKEGGISRNGKPYSAFWKCNGKNPDGSFCTKKPEAGWVKTHNAEKALAASVA